MKILAIDPGNIESAYVVWDGENILRMGKILNEEILNILEGETYHHLAIEMIASYGMPVGASIFETCLWAGRFIEKRYVDIYVHNHDLHTLIYRKDVKMHLCNSMKAKDGNIRQALIDRFEPDLEPKKRPKGILKGVSKDIWAALAVAVYYYDTNIK